MEREELEQRIRRCVDAGVRVYDLVLWPMTPMYWMLWPDTQAPPVFHPAWDDIPPMDAGRLADLLVTMRLESALRPASYETVFTNGMGGNRGFPEPWFTK